MDNYGFEKRYQRHQSKFVLGRKTAQELVDSLGKILEIERAPLTTIPECLLTQLKFNISHHEDALSIQPEQLEYQLYFVISNQKSKEYYGDINFVDWNQGKIFMLLEMKTGLFQSNAFYFSNDACILRGIEKTNIEQRNMTFWEYLAFFELDDSLSANLNVPNNAYNKECELENS